MRHKHLFISVLAAAVLMTTTSAYADPIADEKATAAYLESIESIPDNRAGLLTFFTAMPKGGDLHNHLSGAVDAEKYVDWAVKDGYCYAPGSLALAPPPCTPEAKERMTLRVTDDALLRRRLIAAFSMRGFVPTAKESDHDHFFAAFGKFDAIASSHKVESVQNALLHAAQDHETYVELMLGFSGPAKALAERAAQVPEVPEALYEAMAGGLANAVTLAQRQLSTIDGARAEHCAAHRDHLECRPAVRYIDAVNRTAPLRTVFAQALLAFALANHDHRIVGVNLVSPEDDRVALHDYDRQMLMFAFLHTRYSDVHLSMHAGELVLGLVPRSDLRNHIRRAVLVAGAERIGHGVDIAGEDDAPQLLASMHRRHVLVEIALTSNDTILGIRGNAHPLPLYLAAGVPTALVTDDEGVSRIDLTNEFVRAAATYHFSYPQMKQFARNSLEYSFVSGGSLWTDHDYAKVVAACAGFAQNPEPACASLLADNVKMSLEYRLELDLRAFEHQIASRADVPGIP
jgi:adenosine deaminase